MLGRQDQQNRGENKEEILFADGALFFAREVVNAYNRALRDFYKNPWVMLQGSYPGDGTGGWHELLDDPNEPTGTPDDTYASYPPSPACDGQLGGDGAFFLHSPFQ